MNNYIKRTNSLLFILAMISLLAVSALAQDKDEKKDEHQGRQHDHVSQVEKSAVDKAQDAQDKQFLGKGDGIETCPVTGDPVDKDFKVEINGRVVYACCPDCLDTIKKNPDLYLKKDSGVKIEEKQEETKPEGKDEVKFLGKGDGIETCPVTGEPVDKDTKAEINGRVVYACCPGCLDAIKANPDLYLRKTDNKADKK